MADPTNEMAINLPMVAPTAVGDMGAPAPAPAEIAYDDATDSTIVVGKPMHSHDPARISVYAQSINPVSGGWATASSAQTAPAAEKPADAVAVFDVVFSVGIDCGDGVTKTYQVVKRIGIDKCKIACDAECTTPVSVVESKNEQKLAEAAATKKRFRVLAGLE